MKLLSYLSISLFVFILAVSCGSKSAEPEAYSPYKLVPPQNDTAEAKAFLANVKNKKFVTSRSPVWTYDIPESGNIKIDSSIELVLWGAKSATEGIYYNRENIRNLNPSDYTNVPDREVYTYAGIIIKNGTNVFITDISGYENLDAWESEYFDTNTTPYTEKKAGAWDNFPSKAPNGIDWNSSSKAGTLENK